MMLSTREVADLLGIKHWRVIRLAQRHGIEAAGRCLQDRGRPGHGWEDAQVEALRAALDDPRTLLTTREVAAQLGRPLFAIRRLAVQHRFDLRWGDKRGSWTPEMVEQVRQALTGSEGLTAEQRDVLETTAQLGQLDAAAKLGMAPRMLKCHLRAVYARLGVRTLAQAVRAVEARPNSLNRLLKP